MKASQRCVLVLVRRCADQRDLANSPLPVGAEPLTADLADVLGVNVPAQDAVCVNVLADPIHPEQALGHGRIAAAAMMVVELPLS